MPGKHSRGFQPGHAGENCNHLCSPGVIYALGNGVRCSNITRFLGFGVWGRSDRSRSGILAQDQE